MTGRDSLAAVLVIAVGLIGLAALGLAARAFTAALRDLFPRRRPKPGPLAQSVDRIPRGVIEPTEPWPRPGRAGPGSSGAPPEDEHARPNGIGSF